MVQRGGMKMERTQDFLEQFICKSGETIEQLTPNEWQIHRWTTRTFKRLGNVLATEDFDSNPVEDIISLRLSPRSKRTSLPLPTHLLEEALQKGWIIQEVRYKSDGRTPASMIYRMGPGLFLYEQRQQEKEAKNMRVLKETLQEEIDKSSDIFSSSFLTCVRRFAQMDKDEEAWGKERYKTFHHFLIAILRLKREKTRMEYKEVGATYYREIGGSKAFDGYKKHFIQRLEKWLEAPIHELGIISQGTIVPIYFSGKVSGKFSSYDVGVVHATTDLSIADEHYQTDAEVLWLVENRGVLTRMAREVSFIRDTNSFILGVDGQVRGAHRKMIQQLISSPTIKRVMVWTDVDQAGYVITRNLVEGIQKVPYRIVGNDGKIFSSYDDYIEWARDKQYAEQEMTLGGVSDWMKWINK